jgi:Molecular chaperone (small heat shock protein)
MLVARRTQDFMPSLLNDLMDLSWINASNATPKMNIIETKEKYELEFSVPGLAKEDLKLSIDADNNLVVEMLKESKNVKKDENRRYLRREFSSEQFRQTVALPDDIHNEDITAKVENGILKISLPKVSSEEKQKLIQSIEVK